MIYGLIIGTVATLLCFAAIFQSETRKECKKFEKRLKGDWI